MAHKPGLMEMFKSINFDPGVGAEVKNGVKIRGIKIERFPLRFLLVHLLSSYSCLSSRVTYDPIRCYRLCGEYSSTSRAVTWFFGVTYT